MLFHMGEQSKSMANPLGKISSSLAVKRARSQDSRRSQNASPTPTPITKAPKTEEPDEDVGVPAFLRQSKTGMPFSDGCLCSARSCIMQLPTSD